MISGAVNTLLCIALYMSIVSRCFLIHYTVFEHRDSFCIAKDVTIYVKFSVNNNNIITIVELFCIL